MNFKKSKLGLKLASLAFPLFLSGCIHNPYTVEIKDINKDGLSDIAITDSIGKDTAKYIQVNDSQYVNSPFYKANEIKIKKGITESFKYNPYVIKMADLNKDSLTDIIIIHTEIYKAHKYLQRKDGKYNLSIEDLPRSPSSDNDGLLPIYIWAISPGGLLYPSQ